MLSQVGISMQVTVSQLSSVSDKLSFTKAIKKCTARAFFAERREESAGFLR